MRPSYDIFLTYNAEDREIAFLIHDALARRGIKSSVDDESRHSGRLSQAVAKGLRSCRAAALFLGAGPSPWENLETRLLLTQVALEGTPLIPVYLPGAPRDLVLPLFLTEFTSVDFRDGITEDGIDRLIRSVPGRRRRGPSAARSREALRQAIAPSQCILFLGANPEGTQALRLDHEVREIDLALLRARYRESFDVRQQLAVRPSDLQDALLRYRPQIVHFSGHGQADGLYFENESGQRHKVQGSVIARILGEFKAHIRCVVLNACYTKEQAEAIAKYIDCVIGMSSAIDDFAAIQFSVAFYQALAYGSSVKKAFNLACAQIDLAGMGEGDTPQLIAYLKNPDEIFFVETSRRITSLSEGTVQK